MNTEAIAYAEERIQGLKEAEKDALANLSRIQGGILEWEYYVAQQAPAGTPESAGDSAAQEGEPGRTLPLEIVGPDGTTVAGRGVLLEGQNGRSEQEGEAVAPPPAPAKHPPKKDGAR